MAVGVPLNRGTVDRSRAQVGKATKAAELFQTSNVLHHVVGRGGILVPAYTPGSNILSIANTNFLTAFWLPSRYQAISQMWWLGISGDGEIDVTVSTSADTGPTRTYQLESRDEESFQQYEFERSAHGTTPNAHTLQLLPTTASFARWNTGCVWEMPRAELATDANDRGTDPLALANGQPFSTRNTSNLRAALADPVGFGKRVFFHWAVPYSIAGSTNAAYAKSVTGATSPSATSVLSTYLPILGRKRYRGETTVDVKMRVFGWVTGGTGEVQFDTNKAGTVGTPVTFTNTTPAWSDEYTGEIDCTDMIKADGLQGSSSWDEFGILVDNLTSGQTTHITSIVVYEP